MPYRCDPLTHPWNRGRAEAVILDTESYQNLMDRLQHLEAVAAVRVDMARAEKSAVTREEVTHAEIERSQAVMKELMEEIHADRNSFCAACKPTELPSNVHRRTPRRIFKR
jgi:hypothetical protein